MISLGLGENTSLDRDKGDGDEGDEDKGEAVVVRFFTTTTGGAEVVDCTVEAGDEGGFETKGNEGLRDQGIWGAVPVEGEWGGGILGWGNRGIMPAGRGWDGEKLETSAKSVSSSTVAAAIDELWSLNVLDMSF